MTKNNNIVQTINPVDNRILNKYFFLNEKNIERKLYISNQAYKIWKNISIKERIFYLKELSFHMKKKMDHIARLITIEMGKPISQSRLEIKKSIELCNYYANHINDSIFFHYINEKKFHGKCYVEYSSIGPIIGFMPWNFPIWQTIRSSIPNIMLGNVILIKPSTNTSGCSFLLEKIFLRSGFPKGIFQILLIDIDQTESVISHDIIQGVTFTGSYKIGSIIGSLSGKHIKKSILELGGNDAFVVMKDVRDLQKVAKYAVQSRLNNTGQTCISAKRFIVDELILDNFIDLVVQEMKKFHKGDLFDSSTKIGYISRIDLSDRLYKQYLKILSSNGKICLSSNREGNFFSPSLLKIEKNNSFISQEEIFGPIGIIMSFSNENEIPDIVNNTLYGLGASIWTEDLKKAEIISKEIQTGMIFINDIVQSNPMYPFGGVKKSGYGRELSLLSIKEFANCKTFFVKQL
ncbi:aldehyde dehydrogenase family protein [Blattabacterium cuenoti]|uniref:aldehyde dehydrogenase family protein n=1 Tax=Blattabacterium cuenoti TaxID=1653831 RepID=UPI001CC25BB4|nr:aldehyde dehydrogenase family protein [Blattabacterium cuenoti]